MIEGRQYFKHVIDAPSQCFKTPRETLRCKFSCSRVFVVPHGIAQHEELALASGR